MLIGCPVLSLSEEARPCIDIASVNPESSGLAVLCCSAYGGSEGVVFTDISSTREASSLVMGNAIYGCDYGIRNTDGPIEMNVVALENAVGGSTTSDYDGWGDFEDLFSKVTLTEDPFVNAASGDFSLNDTSGGGAECRSALTIGLLGGSGTETVAAAYTIGAIREGAADGEADPPSLIGSSEAGGVGVPGHEFGRWGINNTEDLA
jgi:hypothetical protein